jgi:5-methylthioadenosine/S-adenosylhomocysteine deaminase
VILILGCDILPMTDDDEFWPDAAILIVGDRLAYVGPRSGIPPEATGRDVRVIDGRHRLALPGLINAHTHLGLNIFGAFVDDTDFRDELFEVLYPAEADMTATEGGLSALVGGLEVLKNGGTTLLDLYHHGGRTREAVTALGSRAELALMALDFDLAAPPPRNPRTGWIEDLDPSRGIRELEENVEFALTAQPGDRITWRLGVNTTDTVSDETMERASALAHEHDLGVHMHVSQHQGEVNFSLERRGCTPIEYLDRVGLLDVNLVAAHATVLPGSDVTILARSKAAIAHCPISNAKGGPIMGPIPRFLAEGGKVALGTDSTPADMLEVTRHASVLNKLMTGSVETISATQALRLATIDGARAIGRGHDLGSLEAGKLADLILIDTDQAHLVPMIDVPRTIVYNARGADVRTVVVGGDIVIDNSTSTRIDEERTLALYREAAAGFWTRRGFVPSHH